MAFSFPFMITVVLLSFLIQLAYSYTRNIPEQGRGFDCFSTAHYLLLFTVSRPWRSTSMAFDPKAGAVVCPDKS